MLEKFVKDDKHLEKLRLMMYLVIVLFMCFFFYDIHTQSVNIVEKERYETKNIIKYNIIDNANVEIKYDYYGKYIRRIAYDIVQVIFLIVLMLELRIVERIKSGKHQKN